MEKKTIYIHNGKTYEASSHLGFCSCRHCDLRTECFAEKLHFFCEDVIASSEIFKHVDLSAQLREKAVDYWRKRVDDLGISPYQIELFEQYLKAESGGSDKS